MNHVHRLSLLVFTLALVGCQHNSDTNAVSAGQSPQTDFGAAAGEGAVFPDESYVYKEVGDCAIKAEVYGGAQEGPLKPVVVDIHGGALITGGRHQGDGSRFEALLNDGFVVVSIDYRLAPETKLPEIIKDVQDAFRWVREKGPELFRADPERIGVQGGSAGGYLTFMTGFCIEPRPKALVANFGYGDLIGAWYSEPDPFYCTRPRVLKEKAYSVVGGKEVAELPREHERGTFYLYCRQNGLWPKEVAGFDPHTQPEAFTPYCPLQNVTAEYPPTLMAHGDVDTDVPYEQSLLMAAELSKAGVHYEFITLPLAGHGFSTARPEDRERVQERSHAFLVKYVKNLGKE